MEMVFTQHYLTGQTPYKQSTHKQLKNYSTLDSPLKSSTLRKH